MCKLCEWEFPAFEGGEWLTYQRVDPFVLPKRDVNV